MEQFMIGGLLVQIDYAGIPVLSEGNLQRFRWDGPWDGDRVTLRCVREPFAHCLKTPLAPETLAYGIYSHEGKPLLVYHWGNQRRAFAVWPDDFRVTFDPGMYRQPDLREDWFFSICAFHRQLLNRNACILHASYIDIGGEAILFTGPSGMGKSTQARLWSEHEGAQVINGDRAVLRKVAGKWHVFGYPSCGTSGICINRTLPLRAIVSLKQGTENRVEQIAPAAAVRTLSAAVEFYPWAREEFGQVLDIATQITADTGVLRLVCTPDQRAVAALKQYLEGGQA